MLRKPSRLFIIALLAVTAISVFGVGKIFAASSLTKEDLEKVKDKDFLDGLKTEDLIAEDDYGYLTTMTQYFLADSGETTFTLAITESIYENTTQALSSFTQLEGEESVKEGYLELTNFNTADDAFVIDDAIIDNFKTVYILKDDKILDIYYQTTSYEQDYIFTIAQYFLNKIDGLDNTVVDTDSDGYSDEEELIGGSFALTAASIPETEEDEPETEDISDAEETPDTAVLESEETPEPEVEEVSPAASVEGKLIRTTIKVYKIVSNKKLWIPTAEAFSQMGNKWEDIESVDQTEEEKYPRVKLVRMTGDKKVYYLTEGGLKKHIPNEDVFNSYNNKWEDIVEIEAAEINAFPDVGLIRLEWGNKVYKLEEGKKRWIKTAEAFNQLGLDWNQIAPVNATELSAYPEGETIGETVNNDTGSIAARDNRRIGDIRQLALASELYYDDNGAYPADLDDLVPDIIAKVPIDPLTNEDYYYVQLSSGENYHIGAKLEGEDSSSLENDYDYDSSGEGGFSGEDPIYDITY